MSFLGDKKPRIQLRNLTMQLQENMELEDIVLQMQPFVPGKIIAVKNKTKLALFDKNSLYPQGITTEGVPSGENYNFGSKHGDKFTVCGQRTAWEFIHNAKNGRKEEPVLEPKQPKDLSGVPDKPESDKNGVYFSITSELENDVGLETSMNDMSVRATILTKKVNLGQ